MTTTLPPPGSTRLLTSSTASSSTACRRAFVICLPLRDNAGNPFPDATIRAALERIARIGGGCTTLPSGHGLWVDQHDDLIWDQIMAVTVVVTPSEAVFAAVTETTSWLARLLDQAEIFVLTVPLTGPEPVALNPHSTTATRVRFLDQTAA